MDLNGDGHADILSGSYSRHDKDMAGLFQVLYGNSDGSFRKAEALKGTDGEPLIIPAKGDDQLTEKICTRPFAVDWDSDGQLDLVVGNFGGTFYWFKGEGKGHFRPKAEMIKVNDEPLRIKGHHSDPVVIDWNGDGALDIISGSTDGGVQWAENIAGKGKPPKFAAFKPLIKPSGKAHADGEPLSEADLTGPTTSTRVWVVDVNGDGKLDILVGDSVTLVAPAKGLSVAEFKTKHAAWQKAFEQSQKDQDDNKDEAKQKKARTAFQKLYESRSEFMKEERTGFVWLYLQK